MCRSQPTNGESTEFMQNQKDKTISTRFAPDSNPQDHGSLGKLRMKSRTTANRKTYTKQSKHNTHWKIHKET
jgi:hypothetical protein